MWGILFTNEEHAKVSLRKRRLILGRLPGSDLFLRRPEISRCHLIFFIEEGSVSVELVGRGGAINGAAVSRADVKDGDVLTISTIQIRIHIHKPTPSEMIASRDVL
jgi:pSer/pThr/pTyr-binding forkhead associated (FHA) protein